MSNRKVARVAYVKFAAAFVWIAACDGPNDESPTVAARGRNEWPIHARVDADLQIGPENWFRVDGVVYRGARVIVDPTGTPGGMPGFVICGDVGDGYKSDIYVALYLRFDESDQPQIAARVGYEARAFERAVVDEKCFAGTVVVNSLSVDAGAFEKVKFELQARDACELPFLTISGEIQAR